MDKNVYYSRGTYEQYDEYMELINIVFSGKNDGYFENLLPKLYKPELEPAKNAVIAFEDGKMVAGIGTFPCEIKICGKTIKGMGIGNVAVHPDHRSKGYMKDLMNFAIDDMVANGYDISALGGQRQRYGYFTYDIAGTKYDFYVTRTNIRHAYGNNFDDIANIKIDPLDRNDNESLDKIAEILASKPYYHVRDRERLFDIMSTWGAHPHTIKRDGELIGYFVINGSINEINLANDADFTDVVRAIINRNGECSFKIAPFQTEYVKVLEFLAEGVNLQSDNMYTITCFRRVIDAFLTLKATYANLMDGKMTVLVHGRGGDENFTITVCNNNVTVEATDAQPDIELTHKEAVNIFFANVSTARNRAPAIISQWFPVPIWLYNSDDV